MADGRATSNAFVPLSPTDASMGGQVGCMLTLAAILLFIGGGLIAVFIHDPSGKDMFVVPLVGGAFALVGALMLFGGVRGARGLKIPPAEVSIEGGPRLAPGATVRVRLQQPGPMTIESLKLKVCCERIYQRRVKPDSTSTVQDRDTLWEQLLAEVVNERVPAGAVLEREAVLALPPGAQPSGPAQPDGQIEWRIQV